MKNDETKATIIILSIFSVVCLIIIIPLLIINANNKEKNSFNEYSPIKIDTNGNIDYRSIELQLEEEEYFKKISIMEDYNSNSYTTFNLEKMLWDYIFNYDPNNNKYFKSKSIADYYCMSERNLINSFKELYAVDISEGLDLLPGFYRYYYKKDNTHCLNFAQVSEDYSNNIYVSFESLNYNKEVFTAELYVYEIHQNNTGLEKEYINQLKDSIYRKDYQNSSDIVKKYFKGNVSKKRIEFKLQPKGKYFKYQVLSIKKIN